MKICLLLVPVLCLFSCVAKVRAAVVISEIHYHPLEEDVFNPDGTPALDLTEDIHEFIELQNTDGTAVDVSGWKFVSGVTFTFPAGTTIPANGYRVIARNPARIATVYGLNVATILGPYTGKLSNSDATLQLDNATGTTIDAISYLANFPWPIGADALGANDNFTGINPLPYNYKGRSLQRISTTWSGNDPANWLASALVAGPTPGGPQAVTRAIPKPVVDDFSVTQLADEATLIRQNQQVKIQCRFTSGYQQSPVTGVSVEYFLDDINVGNEPRTTLAMTSIGGGEFTATLPGQVNRSVVRFRFRGNRGDGDEVISPRPESDPQLVPNAAGGKEGWHAYFVMPVRSLTISPAPSQETYDVFVATADIGTPGTRDDTKTLSKNINQNPRRVVADASGGYPRDEVYDSLISPQGAWWNGHVPAIFVEGDGTVHDARIRYHGSRYRRSEGRQSYKFYFPRYQQLKGMTQVFETDKGAPGNQGGTLPDYRYEALGEIYRAAGIPCSYTPRVDFYINNNAVLQRMEQTVVDARFLDSYYAKRAALVPGSRPLEAGDPYKSAGTEEGPYGSGNGGQLASKTIGTPAVTWNPLQRYSITYALEANTWKGYVPFKTVVDGMATARASLPNTAALRAWALANWDVDRTLTYIAIKNWSCCWDDSIHNYYIYRQSDGKWTLMPWDMDFELTSRDPVDVTNYSIFKNNNTWKASFITAFDAEYRQKVWLLTNTLLRADKLSAMTYQGQSLTNLWGNNWLSWIQSRNTAVQTQIAQGPWYQPTQPTHVGPANGVSALPPGALTVSAYSHTSGSTAGVNAHAKTKWELRAATSTWDQPLYVNESTTYLTSLPIPYDQLQWGITYYWRATFMDAQSHPGDTSSETSFTFGSTPITSTVLAMDDLTLWKYDNVSHPVNKAWTQPNFDDSTWAEGAAVLGHSNTPTALANLNPSQVLRTDIALTQPPENTTGRTTFYFRRRFNFPGSVIGAVLKLRQIVDDGDVVYLNGHEVLRVGVSPTAPIVDSTTATRSVGGYAYEGPYNLPTTYLLPGENVLAVEVHQINSTSNDFLMGIQLEATYQIQGFDVALNEVCADNRTGITNAGKHPDYIELFNNTGSAIDLTGWGLTDDALLANKYLFPAGTSIASQAHLIVWADSDATAPGLHTGFGLDNGGQTVILTQGTTIKDNVTFGTQAPDWPIGRATDGIGVWVLVEPSPGALNITKALGSNATIKLNEWMAEPLTGSDWFELYNPDTLPVSLTDLWLSDTPSTPKITKLPPLSFIGPNGYAKFNADSSKRGFNSVNFKLSAAGESLVVTAANGTTTIDAVTFGLQQAGLSEGMLPDGSGNQFPFPNTSSPGDSNWLTLNSVVVNEALSASTPPQQDAIELRNLTGASVNISQWWLSDSTTNLKKFAVPSGTSINANGYLTFTEADFNSGAPGSFGLDSAEGDAAVLSAADANGNLTGYRSQFKFGPAEPGVPFGRVVTSTGADFVSLAALTLGTVNATPNIGPVVINEVMYHPVDAPVGTDNTVDEYIELQNITGTTVKFYDPANPTNRWKLRDAVDFSFPPNASMAPLEIALVVSFNPTTETAQLAAFRSKFSIPNTVAIYGPWIGKLANSTDSVELAKPIAPVAGVAPFVLVDKVDFTTVAPWPITNATTGPDGKGRSLQRLDRLTYGNDAVNWQGANPTAGQLNPTQTVLNVTLETDGDGIPDTWELANNFNPNDPTDATKDTDGDGSSNIEEFLSGTNPRDATSVFVSSLTTPPAGGIHLQFTAMPGKSYSIMQSDTLSPTAWTKLQDVPAQGTQHQVDFTDASGSNRKFYKVITPQLP